jgi:molybdopterin molybdotransferase
MISVEEAQRLILAPLAPVGGEMVGLAEALGRVLAQDVAARATHPPADVSAMDGWALRSQDAAQPGASLTVIGESAAGHVFQGEVGPGQAARIFTGAHMPKGADCVVMQEDCKAEAGQVTLSIAAQPGSHVRPKGLDFAEGRVLLEAGWRVTARDIALLAAMNIPWVKVRRRPRIAILSSGDELALPGEPLPEGGIPASNSLGLAAFCRVLGADPVDLGIAPDDSQGLQTLARGAMGADLALTSGGASVGDRDLVKSALGDIGLEVGFHKVAMRPGKPLLSGRLNGAPFLGLPGNPVSALVTAHLFLGPAIRALLGLSPAILPPRMAKLGGALQSNDRRQDYLRARLETGPDGTPAATPFERQDSAMMAALARANCLIIRPPMSPPAHPGDAVPVLPLGGGGWET